MIVDFNHVPASQLEIHDRLANWAKWCKPCHHSSVLAMFKGYRPYLYPESGSGGIPVNSLQAAEVQKVMKDIPEKQRIAVQWCYILRTGPTKMCRELGVNKEGLMELINQGRTMISNRLKVKEMA